MLKPHAPAQANGIYMATYFYCKRQLETRTGEAPELPLWARVVSGAFANFVTWGVVFPLDAIRSVQQAAPPGSPPPPGLLGSARALLREGGVGRLYRGFGFTLLRAGPVAGVILPLFDLALMALEPRVEPARERLRTWATGQTAGAEVAS